MSSQYERAATLYDLGRFDEAIAILAKCIGEDPGDPEPYVLMGWCHYSKKRFKDAFTSAETAIAKEPDYARAYLIHGAASEMMGKKRMAEQSLRRALEINPESSHGHYLFAWMLTHRAQWKLALEHIEFALKRSPDNAVYQSSRSEILRVLGKRSEAKSASLEALRLSPDDSTPHVQHGKILRAEGKIGEAMQAFREALRADPNDKEAREELLETGRSRFPLYRWLLSYQTLILRVPPQYRILVALAPWWLSKVFRALWDQGLWAKILSVLFGVFWVSTLLISTLAPVLMDGIASFDPRLSMALTKSQRLGSGLALVGFAGTILTILVALAVPPMIPLALCAGFVVCFLVGVIIYALRKK